MLFFLRYSWWNILNHRSFFNIFDDIDVFGKDEEIENPERLSASTIEQLFIDTGYDLKKVKETQRVNVANKLDELPKELKNIQSVKKRKDLFIYTLRT